MIRNAGKERIYVLADYQTCFMYLSSIELFLKSQRLRFLFPFCNFPYNLINEYPSEAEREMAPPPLALLAGPPPFRAALGQKEGGERLNKSSFFFLFPSFSYFLSSFFLFFYLFPLFLPFFLLYFLFRGPTGPWD